MQIRITLLLLGLTAQSLATSAGTELRFNWPRDMVARVDTERTRERQGSSPSSTTVRGSSLLRVSPHPDGLSITYEDVKVQGLPASQQSATVEALTSISSGMIVNTSGDFVRVDDLQSLRAAVRKILGPILTKDAPAEVHALMEQALSEEAVTRSAAQEWQLLVGGWKGLALTTDRHETRSEAPLPMWPDVKVPMKVTVGMIERTECTRGGIRRECAVFEMRSVVDQAGMERVIDKMMSVGGVQRGGVEYERFDSVTTVRIRLETETMVPHELTTVRTAHVTVNVPGQRRTTGSQVDRRLMRFSY